MVEKKLKNTILILADFRDKVEQFKRTNYR